MATDSETILDALYQKISAYFTSDAWSGDAVMVERDDILPEEIPDGGYINISDGDPGEPERVLGGFSVCYYTHHVEIDLIVQSASASRRNERYTALKSGFAAALMSDPTLGGLAAGMLYGEPRSQSNPVTGGEDLKVATIDVYIDYETSSPIPTQE